MASYGITARSHEGLTRNWGRPQMENYMVVHFPETAETYASTWVVQRDRGVYRVQQWREGQIVGTTGTSGLRTDDDFLAYILECAQISFGGRTIPYRVTYVK
jgi:hypothetical protein